MAENPNYNYDEDSADFVEHFAHPAPPPPPQPSGTAAVAMETGGTVGVEKHDESDDEEFCLGPPDRPLERLCPESLQGTAVTDFFPSYKRGDTLRFYELFKPAHRPPRYWARKPKKRVRTLSGVSSTHDEAQNSAINLMEVAPRVESDEDILMRCSEAELLKMRQDKIRKGLLIDLTSPQSLQLFGTGDQTGEEVASQIAPWRYGPASLWYDRIGVPPDAKTVNYGFKVDPAKKHERNIGGEISDPLFSIPEDIFNMVAHYRWEDDIIWTPEQAKEIEQRYENDKSRLARAGWVPHGEVRTMAQFYTKYKDSLPGVNTGALLDILCPKIPPAEGAPKPRLIYPIFPPESNELISGKWEDKIIWDAEHMPELPEPELVPPAVGDDFANLQLPESGESGAEDDEEPPPETGATPSSPIKGQNRLAKKRSRLLLKTGVRGLGSALDDLDIEGSSNPLSGAKNIFNLSNDEFYEGLAAASKALGGRSIAVGVLQHSTPAAELRPIFFPTCLSLTKLRQYHRPMLKRYPQNQQKEGGDQNKPTTVTSLTQRIKEQGELREAERQRSGGGHVFFMRHVSDLTARDGEVCLVEYSEQYPPLLCQTGMASKIINYYKRKPEKDRDVPECKFGQLASAATGLFLGNIQPGQLLQSLCNNMFRAPLYGHQIPSTDFLLIRTRRKLFIRRVNDVFLAGQQVPIVEVPPPNSKAAFNFAKDFLLYHIFRMFLRSNENPPRVRMEDVKKAFPQHTEATIRKRLKSIADFKRAGGSDACYWILRPETRLPSEEELHNMVTPEQFCANFSTLAGEVRLKDAGYGDRAFLAIDEDNADDLQSKMDDEVKAAPWNTTGALISAMKGKCVLEVHGVADPTGCGQGFSYVRLPAKPPKPDEKPPEKVPTGPLASPQPGTSKDAEGANSANKRSVIGTDSDLRKLHVKDARKILQNFGVPEAEIKKLTRWEMIDVIRTMSTEQARAGIDTSFSSKFARSGRFSVHEYHRNFRKECQKVFDLQNRVLALTDPLSSEESNDSADEDDSGKQQKKLTEVEQIGRSVETILRGRGINIQSSSSASNLAPRSSLKQQPEQKEKQRILQITRTFHTPDGQTYDRVEIVRRPALVDAYVRIRTAPGGDEVVRDLASVILGDGKAKKAPNKERDSDKPPAKRGRPAKPRPEGEVPKVKGQRGRKRRIIADAIRENLLGGGGAGTSGTPGASTTGPDGAPSNEPIIGPDGVPCPRIRIKPIPKFNAKFKCSACGAVGHVRSNRNCPLFGKSASGAELSTSAPTGDTSSIMDLSGEPGALATSEDPTTSTVPTTGPGGETLIKVEETKLKVARKLVDHYFEQMKRKSQLKLGRPKKWAKLGAKTWKTPTRDEEKVAEERRNEEDEDVEMRPIMDDEQAQLEAPQRSDDLEEGELRPSEEVGAPLSGETSTADPSKFKFKFKFGSASKPSSRRGSTAPGGGTASTEPGASSSGATGGNDYAKQYKSSHRRIVDPLLALNNVFEKIINPLRTNPTYEAFSLPVDTRSVPDYFAVVTKPMDLATMRKRCVDKVYGSRSDFLEDALLIVTNSRHYNGETHPLTAIAQQLYEAIIGEVGALDAELVPLEKAANPLIEDDFRAFSFILQGVIDEMKRVEGSWPFHDPVNRKKVKDYYDVVKTPMDLSTLSKKLQAGYYRRVSEFLCDLSLLQSNSILYNGPDHILTTIANRMMDVASEQLGRFADRLSECEQNIPLPSTNLSEIDRQRATIGDDAESVATETTFSDFFSASMAAGGSSGPLNAGSALAAFKGHQQMITQGGEERAPGSAASGNANTSAGLEDDLNISSSSSEAEEGEIQEDADMS